MMKNGTPEMILLAMRPSAVSAFVLARMSRRERTMAAKFSSVSARLPPVSRCKTRQTAKKEKPLGRLFKYVLHFRTDEQRIAHRAKRRTDGLLAFHAGRANGLDGRNAGTHRADDEVERVGKDREKALLEASDDEQVGGAHGDERVDEAAEHACPEREPRE